MPVAVAATSDPLDAGFAEQAIGTDHQDRDQQEVRRYLGQAGISVATDVLADQPDSEATDDGARDRVEAAEDHHWKDVQAEAGQPSADLGDVPVQETTHQR